MREKSAAHLSAQAFDEKKVKVQPMEKRLNRDGANYIRALFRWPALMAISFFMAAGRLNIFRGWIAFEFHFTGAIVGAILFWKFAPGLANQRLHINVGTKIWDKVVLSIISLLLFLIIPIVAGLDVGRYGWSHLDSNFAIGGSVLYVAFFILYHWAMLVNEHFEQTSRIQVERSHKVVTTGPYSPINYSGGFYVST